MPVGELAPVVVCKSLSCEGGNVEVSSVVRILEGLLVAVAELEAPLALVDAVSEADVAGAPPYVSENSLSSEAFMLSKADALGPSVPVMPAKGPADPKENAIRRLPRRRGRCSLSSRLFEVPQTWTLDAEGYIGGRRLVEDETELKSRCQEVPP